MLAKKLLSVVLALFFTLSLVSYGLAGGKDKEDKKLDQIKEMLEKLEDQADEKEDLLEEMDEEELEELKEIDLKLPEELLMEELDHGGPH